MVSLNPQRRARVKAAGDAASSTEGQTDPTPTPPAANAPMVTWALWWAGQGWPVFPLKPGTKAPLLANPHPKGDPKRQSCKGECGREGHGANDATIDLDVIRRWWAKTPNAGIGGGADDKVIIDLDFNHQADPDALPLPATRTHLSGRGNGNRHLVYSASHGLAAQVRSGTQVLGRGIDIRAARGSYVVLPPTPHEETGQPYTIEDLTVPVHLLTDAEVKALWPLKAAPARSTSALRATPDEQEHNEAATVTPRGARAALRGILADLREAQPGGRNDLLNKKALRLGRMVGGGALDEAEVRAKIRDAATEAGLDAAEIVKTLDSGIEAGKAKPRKVVEDSLPLDDSRLAEWLATEHLDGQACWTGDLGWLQFDGRVWQAVTEATVTEITRTILRDLHAQEAKRSDDPARLKSLNALHTRTKIGAVVTLLRGVVERRSADFDQHPDLLNVGNGVVDLRTGDLLPHDPHLLLTKITQVEYHPNARHPDWDRAMQALPVDVLDWMQIRLGQAITGYLTPDDVLPVLQGAGRNGKSTLLQPISVALGDHATFAPERLLLATPGDHPTELTLLRGARLVLAEELPEGHRLSVKRLKDVVGTEQITARRIRENDMTWKASHSLFVTTNYEPGVSETDHGTWERLALVRFPYTFRKSAEQVSGPMDKVGDPNLRQRLVQGRQGQHRAVLAWLVAGARRYYEAGQVLPIRPDRVEADTLAWRTRSDLVVAYAAERLVFDPSACVISLDMYEDFSSWLTDRGQKVWADQTFTARFGEHDEMTRHGVTKTRGRVGNLRLSRPYRRAGDGPKDKVTLWSGVRFRTTADDLAEPTQQPGLWGAR